MITNSNFTGFRSCLLIVLLVVFLACKQEKKTVDTIEAEVSEIEKVDSIFDISEIKKVVKPKPIPLTSLADTTFIRLADYSKDFAYDMRYATTNNFLKAKVYDCAECYTRVKTAKTLIAVNKAFKDEGVKIKFYDCYRPNSVQYKMWEIVPNPQYVANPVKGSIHNRGGAVDITLVTLDGEELDMGTDFDFFGKRAYHDNFDLPQEILVNRKLLKDTMEKFGFWSTRTEWWHYNLKGATRDPIANFKWKCE